MNVPVQIWPGLVHHVKVFGECTGSIDVTTVSGGAPPYQVRWSTTTPGAEVPRPRSLGGKSGMCAGSYTVSVTDQLGQSAKHTFEIKQQPQLKILRASIKHIKVYGQATGRIMSSAVIGGTGTGYTCSWSDPTFDATLDAKEGLASGDYVLTLRDSAGAVATETYTVQQPAPLCIAPGAMTMRRGEYSIAESTFAGGSGSYTVQWTQHTYQGDVVLATQQPYLQKVQQGKFTLQVTDTAGASASYTFDLGTVVKRR